MFVARCRINFCNPQKWRILSDFCLKTAQNRGIFSVRCPFKSNKRSHSGDNGDEDPPVPIPNTEVKLVRGESTWHIAPGRITRCRISIKNDRFQAENGHFFYVLTIPPSASYWLNLLNFNQVLLSDLAY